MHLVILWSSSVEGASLVNKGMYGASTGDNNCRSLADLERKYWPVLNTQFQKARRTKLAIR
jgi:hypothetical protein